MMLAIRLVSSSMNFLKASPLRKIGAQPNFSRAVFQAGISVAPWYDFDQRVPLGRRDARCAKNAAPIGVAQRQCPVLSAWEIHRYFGLDTASARMRPPLICSANSPMPETPAVT